MLDFSGASPASSKENIFFSIYLPSFHRGRMFDPAHFINHATLWLLGALLVGMIGYRQLRESFWDLDESIREWTPIPWIPVLMVAIAVSIVAWHILKLPYS